MAPDHASNVLVNVAPEESTLAPRQPSERDDLPEETVVAVVYGTTPEEWYAEYVAEAGDQPERLTIITVGDRFRSAAAQTRAPTTQHTWPRLDAVESPTDLPRICRTVDTYLDHWVDGSAVLYFDSLTELLRKVDPQPAFRFLHVLTWQVAAAGTVGYYRLDRGAHDDRTIDQLRLIFDAELTTAPEPDPRA